MKNENKIYAKKLSLKQKIFGVFMILISLGMIYYGFYLGFTTVSSFRFILAGLFLFVLTIALFRNIINTKPVGIVFGIYLFIDILLSIFFSAFIIMNFILEIGLFIAVIYYLVIKNKK